MSLPRGTVGWSVVCNCDLSWSSFHLLFDKKLAVGLMFYHHRPGLDEHYSEIFTRFFYFRETSHIKSSRNGEITLSFTDIGKPCPNRDFNIANMCLNAVRENKILAKISLFTVVHYRVRS